jgi:hypothetical protein
MLNQELLLLRKTKMIIIWCSMLPSLSSELILKYIIRSMVAIRGSIDIGNQECGFFSLIALQHGRIFYKYSPQS